MADIGERTGLTEGDTILSYNGIEFGPNTRTLGIDIKPHFDQSGRTVIYHEFTFTIWSWLAIPTATGGDSNDYWQALERALSQPAGEFRYESKTLGHNFRINRPNGGGRRDVEWGPKTLNLRVIPHGDIVAEVTWTVTMKLAACPEVDPRFRIMDFVFRIVYDLDSSGYSRRTISGHLTIPQTRRSVNDRTLSDNADRYRELIFATIPSGFRPVSHSFPLDEAKCRMDFNLVCEEMPPTIPPPGIVHASASHTTGTNTFQGDTAKWNGIISAQYELARGVDKSVALQAFLRLAADRKKDLNALLVEKKGIAIWNSFQMTEPEIHGRQTFNGSIGYFVVMERKALLKGGGLWQKVTGGDDWLEWRKSLAETVFHVRGNAKLRFDNADDIIIDLCKDAKPKKEQRTSSLGRPEPRKPGGILENDMPPPEKSYIRYQAQIRAETIDDVVELKGLPVLRDAIRVRQPPPRPAPSPGLTGPFRNPPAGGEFLTGIVRGGVPLPPVIQATAGPGANPAPGGALDPDIPNDTPSIQTRCRPTVAVYLEGQIVRAGYSCVPPTLVKIGKYKAVPANRPGCGFAEKVAATWFGLPIHVATFKFRWLLEGLDGELPIPSNPLVQEW